jgi:hypothetical protein
MTHFGEIKPIRDKAEPIPDAWREPHYRDGRFTRALGGVTVFLAEGAELTPADGIEKVEGAHYDYSDRWPYAFDYDVIAQAEEAAEAEVGNNDTAAYYEAVLQRIYEDPAAQLQHIATEVKFNGHPYQTFGFTLGSRPDAT